MAENFVDELPVKLPPNIVATVKSESIGYTDYGLRVVVGRRLYPIGRFTLYDSGEHDVVQTAFMTMREQKKAWDSVLYAIVGVRNLPVNQVYVRDEETHNAGR